MAAKCPECGSTDKIVKRRMIDNHHAHAELKEIVDFLKNPKKYKDM
jgi:ATP-dependent Zn protease